MNDLLVEFLVALVTKLRYFCPKKMGIVTGMRIVAECTHAPVHRWMDGLTTEFTVIVTIKAQLRHFAGETERGGGPSLVCVGVTDRASHLDSRMNVFFLQIRLGTVAFGTIGIVRSI